MFRLVTDAFPYDPAEPNPDRIVNGPDPEQETAQPSFPPTDPKLLSDFIFSSSPSDDCCLPDSPNRSKRTILRRKKSAGDFKYSVPPSDESASERKLLRSATSTQDLRAMQRSYHRSKSEASFNLTEKHQDKEENKRLAAPKINDMLFSSIGTKIHFNEEHAAEEIFSAYCFFPKSRETLIRDMVEIRHGLTKDKHLRRVDTVFAIILQQKRSGKLIKRYFQFLGETALDDIPRFAKNAVSKLSKEKISFFKILKCISRITHRELRTQTRETLFRDCNLSSALCRAYGEHLWEKELKNLAKRIEKAMHSVDLASISLNPDIIARELAHQDEGHGTANQDAMDCKFDEHAQLFSAFARSLLPIIFELSAPDELQKLCILRRRHIMHFLREHLLEEKEDVISASRIYVSEILYLRLINSHLMSIDSSAVPQSVLLSLTKVLQCLARENPFGTEKKDPIYERLNPLYWEFIEPHRDFVDAISLLPDMD